MEYKYITKGTCSTSICFELNNGVVTNVKFTNGCDGNLQAVSRLVDGMTVAQLEEKCKGIQCEGKPTSCADQLAIAVRAAADQA